MEAMSSASNNIEHMLQEFNRHANQVRQSEVTAEIVKLAIGIESVRHLCQGEAVFNVRQGFWIFTSQFC